MVDEKKDETPVEPEVVPEIPSLDVDDDPDNESNVGEEVETDEWGDVNDGAEA